MKYVQVLVLVALISCIFGCASTPDLPRGGNALVRLEQFDVNSGALDLEIVLVEENHKSYQNIYNKTVDKASIKQVPAAKFEYLLESLEDMGFMDFAKPWGASGGRPGTFKSITVENDNGRWVFPIFKLHSNNPSEEIMEGRRKFKLMDQTVRSCYDSVLALQVVTNQDGKNLFLEEQRKLKEANEQELMKAKK